LGHTTLVWMFLAVSFRNGGSVDYLCVDERHLSVRAEAVSEDIDPKTSPPVAAPLDDRPAQRPGPVMLAGRYGRVEKLSADHAAMLWDALKGHDHIWTYMPSYRSFPDAAAFSGWVSTRAALEDPCSW
jgi:hypothetical protein